MNESFASTLTPDEVRLIQGNRAITASQTQPVPTPQAFNQQISEEEWQVLQLHRVAKQSRVVGGGIVANTPDPLQQQHGIAIVVLLSMDAELRPAFDAAVGSDSQTSAATANALAEALDSIGHWLKILGADESRPSSPGTG